MSLYLGENLISGQVTLVGESRNIGQIIPSAIPLTDAGLHLLDGALIQGSGSYSAFVTYIVGLVSTYPSLFTTESAWQSAVTNYGVCGKFVYNSTNNTVRLPKYNSKIYTGGGTAPVVGNSQGILFTNGESERYINSTFATSGGYAVDMVTTSQVPSSVGTTPNAQYLYSYGIYGLSTDPAKSGIIAQLSDITTSLDGYYYIVVATSTKTDIQVDIDEIATDLNGKADTDLSNVPTSKGILTTSYKNGTSWYRVYSDGWCEQGGYTVGTGNANQQQSITFLKNFMNTSFSFNGAGLAGIINANYFNLITEASRTVSGVVLLGSVNRYWQACGYIN